MFILESEQTCPEIDESKYIILKVFEQAIRDFFSLENALTPIEQRYYETAVDFLFDDSYKVWWGDFERTPQDLLDVFDLDIQWVRDKALKTKELKQNKKQTTLNL